MARGVGVDLLVCGMVGMAIGKAHFRVNHACNLLEIVLCAPEAASGQINVFCSVHCYHFSLVHYRLQMYTFSADFLFFRPDI